MDRRPAGYLIGVFLDRFPIGVARGCPALIWVLEPVGFGDVMMDGVCPAEGVQPLDLSGAAGPKSGVTWGLGEPAARHQLNWVSAPRHRSGDLLPGGVAEFPQNVVDPAGEFAGHRQVGPFCTDTLPGGQEVTMIRRAEAGSGERGFEQRPP